LASKIAEALVTCEGDLKTVAELLEIPLPEVWSKLLEDEDVPKLIKRVMLLQTFEAFGHIKDVAIEHFDDLSPSEVVKTWSQITTMLTSLLAEAPAGGGPGEGTINFNLIQALSNLPTNQPHPQIIDSPVNSNGGRP
jgi:hypothetical protein